MANAQQPITTIPPFNDKQKLPECAVQCDALYAANAGCVPPAGPTAAASQYTACFCSNGVVAPMSTATDVVCGEVCDPTGAKSVASWFRNICSVGGSGGSNKGSGGDSSGGNSGGGTGSGSNGDGTSDDSASETTAAVVNHGHGGTWLSNHWQWVVMIVIVVVAIIGIWIGACIWRRRYLKKKDRQSSLGQKHSGSASHPSWGPPVTGAAAGTAPGAAMTGAPTSMSDHGSNRGSRGFFGGSNRDSAQPSIIEEAGQPQEKKRWTVRERS